MLLAFVEHDRGVMVDTALEAVALARRLAGEEGVPLEALALGADGAGLATALAGRGVDRLHVVEDPLCDEEAPEAWGEAIAALADGLGAVGVVASGTERGNDALAHAAARRDLPLATACVDVAAGQAWELTRLRWGGILHERARLHGVVKLVTAAPHAIGVEAAQEGPAPEVVAHAPGLDPALGRTAPTARGERVAGVTLATAPVVVAGGRGIGGAEGFGVLEELAGLLGGAVGCSRVATSNGWRPHSDQVGQTGTRVAPDLYLACGISGATQHWVGCMHSKRILAINTDAEAPMVARADYAVIGDVHEVLPAVVAEVRARVGLAVGAGEA